MLLDKYGFRVVYNSGFGLNATLGRVIKNESGFGLQHVLTGWLLYKAKFRSF